MIASGPRLRNGQFWLSTGECPMISREEKGWGYRVHNTEYLTDITILLAAAVVIVPLFQSMRMGAVSGFLIAGVIVGPHGLGLIQNIEEIGQFAELGVVLLLFIIGIELSPARLWMMRRLVFGLGVMQLVCTSVILVAAAHFLFGLSFKAAVLIGPALALSSTAIVLQLLSENKSLTSEHGRASVAVLLFQDLAVVPLLALASLLSMPALTIAEDIVLALAESILILALVILGGRYLLQPVLHRVAKSRNPEVFTASAVLLVLGAAVIMEHIGLSMAMGAFLAGLLIADTAFRHQVISETQPFRGFLLGLFFMSMGMSLDLTQFFRDPLLFLGLVVALVVVKALLIWPMAKMFGLTGRGATATSLLLAESGEFALVVFTVALAAGLLDQSLFQQLLLVVLLSMLLTPLLSGIAHGIGRGGGGDAEAKPELTAMEGETETPVIIVGFGRVGGQIGHILELAGVSFSAIDSNPTVVARERAEGRSVFYGDAERPPVLKAMGAGSARVAIIALDDFEAAEKATIMLRDNFPDLTIMARGRDVERCEELHRLGAGVVASETVEASIELARSALVRAEVPEDHIASTVEDFRRRYYERLRR